MRSFLFVVCCLAPCQALVAGIRAPAHAIDRGQLFSLCAQETPTPPPGRRMGATVDQDGKSNVWVSYVAAIGAIEMSLQYSYRNAIRDIRLS